MVLSQVLKADLRKIVAGILFASVTIGNAIQKFYPNDLTMWFRQPEISMSFYSISLVVFFYPWIKRGTLGGLALIILSILAAAFLSWFFGHLWV